MILPVSRESVLCSDYFTRDEHMITQKNSEKAEIWDEGFNSGMTKGIECVLKELQRIIESRSETQDHEIWGEIEKIRRENPYA